MATPYRLKKEHKCDFVAVKITYPMKKLLANLKNEGDSVRREIIIYFSEIESTNVSYKWSPINMSPAPPRIEIRNQVKIL